MGGSYAVSRSRSAAGESETTTIEAYSRRTKRSSMACAINFLRDERLRNDTGHVSIGGKHGIRDRAHETDSRAAIDETDLAQCEHAPQFLRHVSILRSGAKARSGEHAHSRGIQASLF